MATGTFSARIMRLWYRDRLLKATLAVLVGTLTFSFSVLRRIDDDFVPDLGVTLSGFFVSLSLLAFIVFFDRSLRRLRPAAVRGCRAHGSFDVRADGAPRRSAEIRWEYGTPPRIQHSSCERAAGGSGCRSRRSRRVGSRASRRTRPAAPGRHFVHTGGALVRVSEARSTIVPHRAQGMIALGDERTFEQDPRSRYG